MGAAVGLGVAQLDLDGVAAQLALELVRGALGHHPAAVDDGQAPGQPVGLLQVVGGEQDGQALGAGQMGDLGHLSARTSGSGPPTATAAKPSPSRARTSL
jgi:hypothetical protein